jgi:DNA-binding transcriptional LysR family regulator
MLAEWEGFEQQVDQMKGLSRGRLRVAAVSTAKYFIPRLIGSFCRLHPAIDVSLEVLNRDGVVARLRDNRDDIYIMSMPPELDLEDEVFMENPLVVIAARGAKLGRSLSLAQLKDQRFILREPGSGTRMATDRHFAKRRFRPDVRLELGSNEAIREAVAGGLGLGVISRHALQVGKDIRVLDVEGFPISSRWHVVHPRAKHLSPIAAAFRAHLLAHAGKP